MLFTERYSSEKLTENGIVNTSKYYAPSYASLISYNVFQSAINSTRIDKIYAYPKIRSFNHLNLILRLSKRIVFQKSLKLANLNNRFFKVKLSCCNVITAAALCCRRKPNDGIIFKNKVNVLHLKEFSPIIAPLILLDNL